MNSPSSTITTARPGQPLAPPSLTSGAAPASEAFPRVAGRSLTLTILLVVFALNFMDRQILAVLAEPIKRDLALSDTQLGLLYGLAFAVFYSILGIPLGRLADRFDRARILTVSVALFSLMTALCGVAASYWQLLLARIGVGIGEAGTNPPSHSMIADLFPVDRRSTAMSIFALGPCLGVLLGFLVGGWFGQILGWRVAFLIAGVVGLVVAAAAHWLLRDPGRVDAQGVTQQPHALPGPRAVWRDTVATHIDAPSVHRRGCYAVSQRMPRPVGCPRSSSGLTACP